jgi:tetratricopeptide (TPR) repeat protein
LVLRSTDGAFGPRAAAHLRERLAAAGDFLAAPRGQAAVCLLLLLAAFLIPHGIARQVNLFGPMHVAAAGELLLHGFSADLATYNMPLAGMGAALAHFHLGPGAFSALMMLLKVAGALLVFNLGLLGGLPLAGAVSALSFLFLDLGVFEQVVYAIYILLALNMLGYRFRRNTLASGLLAGLALGMTLLIRSPLCLFPLGVVLWDIARGDGPARPRLLKAAVLLAASYMLLLPWMRMNYSLHGRVVPFEYGRGDCNMITGAKGSVFTIEGDCRGMLEPADRGRVAAWAAATVLNDPWRYALAVARRIIAVFSMHPLLFCAAFAGFLLYRNRLTLLVGAVVAYFVFVHSLLSVEAPYILPMKPLLVFLAASGVFGFLRGACAQREYRPALLLWVFFILAVPAAAAELLVLAYPSRAVSSFAGLKDRIERYPRDAWLIGRKAALYLSGGRTDEGLGLLREYAGLVDDPNVSGILSVLDGLAGEQVPAGAQYEYLLVRTLKRLESGGRGQLDGDLAVMRDHWFGKLNALTGKGAAGDLAVERELQAANKFDAGSAVASLLYFWPREKRGPLLDLIQGAHKGGGKRPEGRTATAEILGLGSVDLRELYRDAFERNWLPLFAGGPSGPVRAVCLAYEKSGDERFRRNVVDALLPPGESSGVSEEVLYMAGFSGAPVSPEIDVFFRKKLDSEPGIYLMSGQTLAALGNPSGQLSGLLGHLEGLNPDPEQRHRIALIYQASGENKKALLLINGLMEKHRNAKLLNDRGVLYMMSGRRDSAIEDFSAALRLDPGLKDAKRNLDFASGAAAPDRGGS